MSEHLHYQCTRVPGPIKKKSGGWISLPLPKPVVTEYTAEKEECPPEEELVVVQVKDKVPQVRIPGPLDGTEPRGLVDLLRAVWKYLTGR